MAFFYCLFILITKTVSSQFTPHVDLQKLGEIILKGKKYNILKPTVHEISDRIDDEKLRRDTRDEEIDFMDNYGFRHFWKGFGKRKSYSKTENGVENYRRDDFVDINEEDGALRKASLAKAKSLPKPVAKPAVKLKLAAKPKPAAKAELAAKAKPAAKPNPAARVKSSARAKPAARAKAAARTNPTAKPVAETTKTKDAANTGGNRTLATSYFFCPFFGVIAMKGFVD